MRASIWSYVIVVLTGVLSAWFLFGLGHAAQIIFLPDPLFSREINAPGIAEAWRRGLTPYTDAAMPTGVDVYGIFHLIVGRLLPASSDNVFLPLRLVSFISTLAAAILMAAVMLRQTKKTALDYVTAVLLALGLVAIGIRAGALIAKPDMLGYALFWSSILLPRFYGHSFKSCCVALLLGLLAYQTKPYFLIGPLYVLLTAFIFNPRRGIILGVLFGLIFAALVASLYKLLPWYWWSTFWIHVSYSDDFGNRSVLVKNLLHIARDNIGVCVLLLCGLAAAVYGARRIKKVKRQPYSFYLARFREWVDTDGGYITLYFLLSLKMVLRLESFGGGSFIYFYHLTFPALMMMAFAYTSRLDLRVRYALLLVLFAQTAMWTRALTDIHYDLDAYHAYWNKTRSYAERKGEVFGNSWISHILIEQGKPVYDYGQTQYFLFPAFGVHSKKHFSAQSIQIARDVWVDYWDTVRAKIADGKFAALMLEAPPPAPTPTLLMSMYNSDARVRDPNDPAAHPKPPEGELKDFYALIKRHYHMETRLKPVQDGISDVFGPM